MPRGADSAIGLIPAVHLGLFSHGTYHPAIITRLPGTYGILQLVSEPTRQRVTSGSLHFLDGIRKALTGRFMLPGQIACHRMRIGGLLGRHTTDTGRLPRPCLQE